MHDEGRSFRGTGTFCGVRVTWIVKGLTSSVVRNNLPQARSPPSLLFIGTL